MANYNSKEGQVIDVRPLRTMEEVKEMIEALGMNKKGLRNQMLFKLGISTGLRCSDLIKIKVSDVKGKTSFVLNEKKTDKTRTIYLNPVLADLMDYLAALPADEEYLFPNDKGGHISVTQVYRILAKAGDLIGNNSIGTHTMRKTFGYRYYQNTKDIAHLMEIFNHSSQGVTLRYIGVTEERIEQSIKDIKFF